MATEPQKICPQTPKKEKRKFVTVNVETPMFTKIDDAEISCHIDPNNPVRAILPSELKYSYLRLRTIRFKNSNIVIHVQNAIDNSHKCKTYHASISYDSCVIHANCILRINEMILDMRSYYDKGDPVRTLTMMVLTGIDKYVDFTQLQLSAVNKLLKTEMTKSVDASLNHLNFEWADKPAPLSYMFTKVVSPEPPAKDSIEKFAQSSVQAVSNKQ